MVDIVNLDGRPNNPGVRVVKHMRSLRELIPPLPLVHPVNGHMMASSGEHKYLRPRQRRSGARVRSLNNPNAEQRRTGDTLYIESCLL